MRHPMYCDKIRVAKLLLLHIHIHRTPLNSTAQQHSLQFSDAPHKAREIAKGSITRRQQGEL